MSDPTSLAHTGCKKPTEQEVMAIIIGLSVTCGILITVFFIYLGYAMHHKKRAYHAEQQLYALYAKYAENASASGPHGAAGVLQTTRSAPMRRAQPVTVESVEED